jgi:hypothetical protein
MERSFLEPLDAEADHAAELRDLERLADHAGHDVGRVGAHGQFMP